MQTNIETRRCAKSKNSLVVKFSYDSYCDAYTPCSLLTNQRRCCTCVHWTDDTVYDGTCTNSPIGNKLEVGVDKDNWCGKWNKSATGVVSAAGLKCCDACMWYVDVPRDVWQTATTLGPYRRMVEIIEEERARL